MAHKYMVKSLSQDIVDPRLLEETLNGGAADGWRLVEIVQSPQVRDREDPMQRISPGLVLVFERPCA